MPEKNVNQRLLLIGAIIVIGVVLLYPPSERLRPGLDIAGGTSLIFEIDTEDAANDADLAERLKTYLQRRVDPRGVYNLTWRVQGRNRLEVQMPLPPAEAKQRREDFAAALADLFDAELKRSAIEAAIRTAPPEREERLAELAQRRAPETIGYLAEFDEAEGLAGTARDEARAALGEKIGPAAVTYLEEQVARDGEFLAQLRSAVQAGVDNRLGLLRTAAERYDALLAARDARDRGPTTRPTTQPDGTTQPALTAEELEESYRDASELYDDAIVAVLDTNLNRRRFEDVIALERNSQVRENSIQHIRDMHPDLVLEIEDVLAKHAEYAGKKRYLDSPADLKRLVQGSGRLEFRILPTPDMSNPTRYDRYRQQLAEGQLRIPGQPEGWFKIDNPLQFFNLNSPVELEQFDVRNAGNFVVDQSGEDYYVLSKTTPNDGLLRTEDSRWKLTSARVDRDEHGRWCVPSSWT
jgi:SecD/SecF fusion protein